MNGKIMQRTCTGMPTRVGMLFMCVLLICLLFSAAPARAEETSAESDPALTDLIDGWPQMGEIHEATGFLIDAENGGILYSKNSDVIRYPASTTKVLTALIALERAELSDEVTMTETGVQMVASGSANAQTVVGERFSVEQCLYMLLLKSANDIANQLAETVAGSVAQFAEMMNTYAEELGCIGTHFTNPSGMPDSMHYTTAEDMAKIVQAAIRNETFLKIAGTESVTIPPTNKTKESRTYTNHNALIVSGSEYYYEPCIAGKTGYTDAAWRTYVAAAEKDGRTLVLVLMKGPDRSDFADAAKLFEYGFNQFDRIQVEGGSVNLPKGKTLADTTHEEVDAGGAKEVRYYYNGLFVGKGSPAQEKAQ